VTEYLFSTDEPVTLITTFRLADLASADRFAELWTDVGNLMAVEPGFVSAHLYHPMVGGEPGEYVHVAQWTSAALLAEAQSDPKIRALQRMVEDLVLSARHLLCDLAAGAIHPLNEAPPGPSTTSTEHHLDQPDPEP
jgi:heme-degrading monooxygenase HmoA